MFNFLHYQQQEAADCGPACLRMIAKYYGKIILPKCFGNIRTSQEKVFPC